MFEHLETRHQLVSRSGVRHELLGKQVPAVAIAAIEVVAAGAAANWSVARYRSLSAAPPAASSCRDSRRARSATGAQALYYSCNRRYATRVTLQSATVTTPTFAALRCAMMIATRIVRSVKSIGVRLSKAIAATMVSYAGIVCVPVYADANSLVTLPRGVRSPATKSRVYFPSRSWVSTTSHAISARAAVSFRLKISTGLTRPILRRLATLT
jgi:hypothetical protein